MDLLERNARTFWYVRVSTEEQAKSGLGMEAQLARIKWYCEGNKEKLPEIFPEPYVDDGVSSTVKFMARKAGRAMHNELRKGDHVVIAKLDRLGRDVRDVFDTTEQWADMGVVIHCLDVAGSIVDTKSAMGRFMLGMIALFAQFERDRMSERTKEALAAWRARGCPSRRVMQFGPGYRGKWDWRAKRCIKVRFEPEWEQMKRIYDMRLSGMEFTDIRLKLAADKDYRHWCRLKYRMQQGKRISEMVWSRKPWAQGAVIEAYAVYVNEVPGANTDEATKLVRVVSGKNRV